MIVKTINKNIYKPMSNYIAFSINTEDGLYGNFSQYIARNYWPELFNKGYNELGEVLSKKVGDVTFYALVCYSIKNGFNENQESIIRMCFDKIPIYDETIDAVEISLGMYGYSLGIDINKIIYGMHLSNKKINLYTKYSLEEIKRICNEMSLEYYNKKKVLDLNDIDCDSKIPKEFHSKI